MASKKVKDKQKTKTISDLTFGLKNKKSTKVNKFVQQVTSQVQSGNTNQTRLADDVFQKAKLKKEKEQEDKLLREIYKTVETVKVIKVDNKEVKIKICPFFRQGLCQKGKKCKLSHDLTDEKSEVLDLYTDNRNQLAETSDKWDEKKLKEVVAQQEAKYKMQKPTEIVCKYFLDAVENGHYGWKWVCNNGITCHYRHCLPPGFVYKNKKKDINVDTVEEQIAMEEQVEEDKRKLDFKKGTPMTLERFLAWKKKKASQKKQQQELKKKIEIKRGNLKGMSGRALFDYDSTLFVDADGAADDQEYINREQSDEENNDQQEVIYEGQFEDDEEEQLEKINQQQDQINEQKKKEDEQGDEQLISETIQKEPKKEDDENNDQIVQNQDQLEKKKKKKKNKNKKQDNNGVDINDDAFDF